MALQDYVTDICNKLREEKEVVIDTTDMAARKLMAGVMATHILGPGAVSTMENMLKELMAISEHNYKLMEELATLEDVEKLKKKGAKDAIKKG